MPARTSVPGAYQTTEAVAPRSEVVDMHGPREERRPSGRQPEVGEPPSVDGGTTARHASPDAIGRLMPLVYDELRRIAHHQLRAERPGHTLSTTALVHEVYLKLADQTRAQWIDRAQFFAIAARAMRRILVDYARRHYATRRGGPGRRAVALDALDDAGALVVAERADELIALDEALERLALLDERLARLVECRFFAGLSETEAAAVFGVSRRTIAREWVTAKGWLYQELRGDAG